MRFIGRKTLLLDNIHEVILEHAPDAKTFCDIFSGSGTVARYFKQWYEVSSNDLLYFSYVLQKATVENDNLPTFDKLSQTLNINDPITYLNSLELQEMEYLAQEKRFFQNTYAPIGNRMYLNNENALRIDYIRILIETWYQNHLLNENEYYYLLACLIEGIPFVSNISGTYGAYHKTWDKRTYKKFELIRLDVISNRKNNKCFNQDGNELIHALQGDVLYIDPPYNSRQYLPNYHLLETAALYDYPIAKGVTGQRNYDNKKSDFCIKNKVLSSFEDLIKNAHFKHIILSYSTDGLMTLSDIETIMKKYGLPATFKIYWIPYRRYKSRPQKEKNTLKEMLVYIQKEVH